MKKSTYDKIERLVDRYDFFAGVFSDYLDRDDVDWITDVDDIENELENNGAFNIDIIYYSNAMEYLTKHDPSLTISLELALDYGYSVRDLSSKTLASILASALAREKWADLRNEIEDILYSEED